MFSETAMASKHNPVIQCHELGKCFRIYDNPKARLKQAIWRGRRQYFREFWALRHVNFEVRRGESLGIIGRNGSGKSTLLQLICGTLTPTEGSIQTNGRVAALLELGSGFNPEFTGIENVYLNASMLGLSKQETDARLDKILGFADIGEFIDQPVKTYSSGMAVRLAFSVIAHVDADILVVDEALAVGDTVFVNRCMRFIRRMREERCLLFVSHDAEAVKSLCSHTLWLLNGQQHSYGYCREVCLDYFRHCTAETYGDKAEIEKTGPELPRNSEKSSVKWQTEIRDNLLDYNCTASFYDNLTEANGWKTGAAELISVRVYEGGSDTALSILKGGEYVDIEIKAIAHQELQMPALGFTLANNHGQHILGENTLITRERDGISKARAGDILKAKFNLWFPMLPSGEYLLMASIADGTLENHIQHHWTENAALIRVNSSGVRYGLVGAFLRNASLDMMSELESS